MKADDGGVIGKLTINTRKGPNGQKSKQDHVFSLDDELAKHDVSDDSSDVPKDHKFVLLKGRPQPSCALSTEHDGDNDHPPQRVAILGKASR